METNNRAEQTEQGNKAKRNPSIRIIKGKEYLISEKAAEYLGISKMCLYNYRKKRKLFSIKFGGGRYYKQEWLDDLIEELKEK